MRLTRRQSDGYPGTFWIALDPKLIKQRGESMEEIVGHEVAHVATSEYYLAIAEDNDKLATLWEELLCNILGKLLSEVV